MAETRTAWDWQADEGWTTFPQSQVTGEPGVEIKCIATGPLPRPELAARADACAAHIALCVNQHDALVAERDALRAALKAYRSLDTLGQTHTRAECKALADAALAKVA